MRVCVLILLLLLSACARPDREPMPLPAGEELLERLAQVRGGYRNLDGEAKVGVTVNGRFFPSQQFLLLEKPDRFRTDALSAFGQLYLQLAVDRDDLSVFLNTTVPGRFYQGPASDDNLARFTRLPVRFKDLIRLFLYDPPLIYGGDMQVRQHKQGVQLDILGDQQRQEIVFDRQLRPVESRYYQREMLHLRVVYEKFSESEGFPMNIRLEIPQQKTSASVRFSQIRVNTRIPAERFVIDPPANAQLEFLPH